MSVSGQLTMTRFKPWTCWLKASATSWLGTWWRQSVSSRKHVDFCMYCSRRNHQTYQH